MLMYQKKFEVQIGEDSIGQSSDLSIGIPSCFLHQIEPNKQSTTRTTRPILPTHHSPTQPRPRTLPRLHIEIPPISSNCSSPRNQNEPISRNQSTTKTLISTPHKRSMMSQSPSLSRSPTLTSLRHNHHHQQQVNQEAPASGAAVAVGSGRSQDQTALSLQQPRHYHEKASISNPDVSYHSFLCSPSSPVFLATKRITLRFIHHSCHASWLKVHLKFFMLISLPSVYLLTLTRHWSFLIRFLYVLAFSVLLVFAIHLALPRLPSIRFFLARILCIKHSSLTPLPKHHHHHHHHRHPPVIWSIGAKPKPEKGPISGSWVQVYSNGDMYEGEFHKGKCSGSGVYYYHLSGRYEGDWIDEKYDGYGVETWAKGSRYRGQYRQGLRHGVGFYRSYTGDSYSGEWCNGQCHGFGLHACEDGSSYVGEFKLGAKHGLGHYHFRNGDTYAGEYFADKMHGFGVYQFGNGHRYEGAWHEGRRQGFGSYTFRNGDTHSGHWQNGILSASSSIHGTIVGSSLPLDHAKVLHAVQEARRAAEKAGKLVNVDERVKRAVAAANRAATAARVAAVKAVQNQMHENEDCKEVPLRSDV